MLAYRVFPYDSSAPAGAPGHPDYLHRPQGRGRLDNPSHYDTWYMATSPEAAVGEALGDLRTWSESMFEVPYLPRGRRALAVFNIPDEVALLDLDDAQNLLDRGLRPTQVVSRNRSASQAWALRIFNERSGAGIRAYAGVRWWSFQRPHWTILGLWVEPGGPAPHRLVEVEALNISHRAVRDAAVSLAKIIT